MATKKNKPPESNSPQPRRFLNCMVVRIGDKHRPAGPEDIQDMTQQIRKMLSDVANPVLITHHAVTFETIQIPCDKGSIIVVGGDPDENEFDAQTPILIT